LPDTDLKGGAIAAEKIRSRLSEEVVKADEHSLKLSLTVGVAEYKDGQTLEKCIKDADTARYKAKNQGRNRVEVFEDKELEV